MNATPTPGVSVSTVPTCFGPADCRNDKEAGFNAVALFLALVVSLLILAMIVTRRSGN
jgi:hypothetical protein